jgi:hypothetical protein
MRASSILALSDALATLETVGGTLSHRSIAAREYGIPPRCLEQISPHGGFTPARPSAWMEVQGSWRSAKISSCSSLYWRMHSLDLRIQECL